MMTNFNKLGNYIRQIDVRNNDSTVKLLLGVSIEKTFISSHANTVGVDFSKYKIVKKGQFAYGPVTSRNGDKISIALLTEEKQCLVSTSYITFEIFNKELLPEFLQLLFKNPEFDRYARYNSWGSAREVFSWDDLCATEIYIPTILEQRKIVNAYKNINNHILKNNEEINTLLNSIKILYSSKVNKHSDYKTIGELCNVFTGKKDVNQASKVGKYHFWSCAPSPLWSDEKVFEGEAVLVAGNGSYTGRTTFVNESFDLYQRTYAITPKKEGIIHCVYASMLTTFQEELKEKEHGSAIPYIVIGDITEIKVFGINDSKFDLKLKKITDRIVLLQKINDKLERINTIIQNRLM